LTVALFMSRPAMLSASQGSILHAWSTELERRGASLRSLARSEYVPDPFRLLRSELRRVDGVVVFGFRHMQLLNGVACADTCEERDVPHALASPWMHIEAGLALSAGLPLLALAEIGVSEGIFDPAAWGGEVVGHDLSPTPSATVLDRFLAAAEGKCRRDRSPSVRAPERTSEGKMRYSTTMRRPGTP